MSREALARSLDALSQYVVGEATVADTLARVATMTAEAIVAADLVGMTLLVNNKITTAVFTDPEAAEIDQAQYVSGDGPCVESFRTGRKVAIPSTSDDRRFRVFSQVCVDHGIWSTLSMPMSAGERRLGAMNLYSRRPHAFSAGDELAAERFATHASVVLANAQIYEESVTLSTQLRTAMQSRTTIDLARGIIMASTGCTVDEAFQRLVDESQHTNIKLREVAARIVDQAARRTSED
jgi:GAF domain-containing protein